MLCQVIDTKYVFKQLHGNKQEAYFIINLVGTNGRYFRGQTDKKIVPRNTVRPCKFRPGDVVRISEDGTQAHDIVKLFEPSPIESMSRLSNIKGWEDDALLDNTERYFYLTRQAKDILSQDKWLVLGNKGTGKTAIARHIASLNGKDGIWNRTLNFASYIHYEDFLAKRAPNSERGLVDLWRYIILSAAVECLMADDTLDIETQNKLTPFFPKNSARTPSILPDWLRSALSPKKVALVGAASGVAYLAPDPAQAALAAAQFLPHILEKTPNTSSEERSDNDNQRLNEDLVAASNQRLLHILSNCKFPGYEPRRIFVTLDQLDESYNQYTKEECFQIIAALLNAAKEMNSFFAASPNASCRVSVTVFLRTDIFNCNGIASRIQQNFFLSKSVDLTWAAKDNELRQLIAFRIGRASRAFDIQGEFRDPKGGYTFEDEWYSIAAEIFPPLEIETNKSVPLYYKSAERDRSILSRLLEHTTRTPRDFVVALRACAATALDRGTPRISQESLSIAIADICKYVITHMGDQIKAEISDYALVKKAFQRMGKSRFLMSEFANQLIDLGLARTQMEAELLCQVLFEHNLIGIVKPSGGVVFKYENPGYIFDFNSKSSFAAHKALMNVLSIAD